MGLHLVQHIMSSSLGTFCVLEPKDRLRERLHLSLTDHTSDIDFIHAQTNGRPTLYPEFVHAT